MLLNVASTRRHCIFREPGLQGVHGIDFVGVGERFRCSFAICSAIFGLVCFLLIAGERVGGGGFFGLILKYRFIIFVIDGQV